MSSVSASSICRVGSRRRRADGCCWSRSSTRGRGICRSGWRRRLSGFRMRAGSRIAPRSNTCGSPGRCGSYPRLAEEMGAGRLSFSQVRAISRIASRVRTGLVEDLIEVARHGTVAQLEVVVRGLRTVDHNEQGHRSR